MKKNIEVYEKKYKDNYGIQSPESHVIRIYEHFLKNILIDKENVKILDFGCGNGTHTKYFANKDFFTVGIDISENAIEYAKKWNKNKNNEFICINVFEEDISNYGQFDLIFANQSLYYLQTNEIDNLMIKFEKMLKDDGIVVFTMMSINNYYYKYATLLQNGLYKVELQGRLNETTYITFVEDESHLNSLFKKFTPLYVGKYDFTMKEGSSEHFYFIGKKY